MKKQNRSVPTLTPEGTHVMERFRAHPQMMERVQSILEIAYSQEGPLKTADQVEDLLVDERRRLGHATMNQWAGQSEERVMADLKEQDPTVRSRKKKTLTGGACSAG